MSAFPKGFFWGGAPPTSTRAAGMPAAAAQP